MARRYSGYVTVEIFCEEDSTYFGRVSVSSGYKRGATVPTWEFDGLRLSPHDAAKVSAGSAEAYDLAAEVALGFGSNAGEKVTCPTCAEWVRHGCFPMVGGCCVCKRACPDCDGKGYTRSPDPRFCEELIGNSEINPGFPHEMRFLISRKKLMSDKGSA